MKTKPTIMSIERAQEILDAEFGGKCIIRDYKKEKKIRELKEEIKQLGYELKEAQER